MECGRIQELPKFFEYPLLSQVKLRTSTFVRTFLLSIRAKVHYKISGKVAGCVVRTLKTFQGTHILGASCGLLCDSSGVLFDMHAASFKHSLLSVDVDVCMYVRASLKLNISETNRDGSTGCDIFIELYRLHLCDACLQCFDAVIGRASRLLKLLLWKPLGQWLV